MNIEKLREYCLSLPGTEEDLKWGSDLCFVVGGKIYAITGASADAEFGCSLKCDPETFARLIERENITPAPYLARYHWVAIRSADALSSNEWRERIKASYQSVVQKLPAKVRAKIEQAS